MTSHRTLLALAATTIGAVALTGCGNGLTGSATRQHTEVVTTQASPSASASITTSTSASPTPTGGSRPASTPVCTVADLSVGKQASAGGAAAGSDFILLSFTNVSRTTCSMQGHPGVSFVGKHNGTQIGRPAVRTGSLRYVKLAPGERTTAVLQIANAADYDAATCAPTTTDGFRVYPPGSTASVLVRFRTQACQGDLSSTGSPQLSVSAVGTSA